MAGQRLGGAAAVRHVLPEGSECAARADYGPQQPAGRGAITKLQAVGDDVPDTQVLRQRAHDVLQRLAHQYDVRSCLHEFLYFLDARRF